MKIIYIIFLALSIGVHSQSTDCSKFKTGTFKYTNPNLQYHKIIRNDSIQIEIDENTNIKIVGTIKWISNCQYTLTYKEVNNPAYNMIIGTSFNVDINSVNGNTYTYTAFDDTRKMNGEILKINE